VLKKTKTNLTEQIRNKFNWSGHVILRERKLNNARSGMLSPVAFERQWISKTEGV
tara:strand:+ start:5485 stop:5649 length:165 start_codon:yes stop_codon:yes gene_type:complete